MKWSVMGLVLLAVVAAVCAAVLVGSLRAGLRGAAAQEVESAVVKVLVAAKDMPAMSVVDAGAIREKQVARDQAPEEFISNPVQAIGKVLALPMAEGQPFSSGCFASEGTGMQLAAALPQGMRAVSISLTQHSGLDGLLYPGSVVDVLASFQVNAEKDKLQEAVSAVLIQGVEVLAVEDRTVVSDTGKDSTDSALGRASQYGRKRKVTLLVTPKQAEALQLAMEHGRLSLAMRNPLDATPSRRKGTFLSELSEDFAQLSREMGSGARRQPPSALPQWAGVGAGGWSWPWRPQGATPPTTQPAVRGPLAPPAPPVHVDQPPDAGLAGSGKWETVVLRGGKARKQSFPVREENEEH